jgi:integrase
METFLPKGISSFLLTGFKKIGKKHYGTHAMRHTFATRLLSKTSSHQEIKAVAELLGDDYKVVAKTYLHTDETGKHNLVDMLNE